MCTRSSGSIPKFFCINFQIILYFVVTYNIPISSHLQGCYILVCLFLQAVIDDVESHREALNKLGAAVSVVVDLVDDSDQQLLRQRLGDVTGRYNELKFDSNSYLVDRWLEDRESQLCGLAPSGVLVSPLQVRTCRIVGLP